MKLIGMTALAALAFVSCGKPSTVTRTDDASPAAEDVPAVAPPTPVSTTPAPIAAATPPPATPATPAPAPAPELAPPGVFYVVAAASIETADGLHGLPPGTGVKLVRPGFYLTPYGEAAIDPAKLTNNMALARQAMRTDAASQATLRQTLAAQARAAVEKQRAIDAIAPATPDPGAKAAAVTAPAAPARPPMGSALGGGGLQGSEKIGTLKDRTRDRTGVDAEGRTYWIDIRGRRRYD